MGHQFCYCGTLLFSKDECKHLYLELQLQRNLLLYHLVQSFEAALGPYFPVKLGLLQLSVDASTEVDAKAGTEGDLSLVLQQVLKPMLMLKQVLKLTLKLLLKWTLRLSVLKRTARLEEPSASGWYI